MIDSTNNVCEECGHWLHYFCGKVTSFVDGDEDTPKTVICKDCDGDTQI